MKDLTFKKAEKKEYIINIEEDKGNTLIVNYADGGYSRKIQNTSNNIKLAEDKMEQQAKTAVEKIKSYKTKVTMDKLALAVHATTPSGTAYILNSNFDVYQDNPQTLMLVTGTVTLVGVFAWMMQYLKDKSRLKEVEKIKYRDDNREKLEGFKEHCNSLNGLHQKTIRNLTREENPFGIRNLDNLSQKTLERIIENIEREEQIPFTYAESEPVKAR